MAATNIVQLPSAELMSHPEQPLRVSSDKLMIAQKRMKLATAVINLMNQTGWSLNRSAEHIHHIAAAPTHELHDDATTLGKSGKVVSKAQISRWVKAYNKGGMEALIDTRTGRKAAERGWELRAMALYAMPQKPSFQLVLEQLQEEGFNGVTYAAVRRYLRSLPTNLTELSNGRVGAKEARLNHRGYVERNMDNLLPGDIYQMDGHTIDAYIKHPTGRKVWRPELTIVMDVKSRFIPGWWVSEAESSQSTLFALSEALLRWDHCPAMLHIDNGSGFKSKMMNDASTGYYNRFGIKTMFAIPGRATAKGQVERWFRTLKERFHKKFDSYCGDDMVASVKNKLVLKANKGEIELTTLERYLELLTAFIDGYNNTPHRGLDGKTPASVWQGLKPTPLHIPAAALVLPRAAVNVRRNRFILHKRHYSHPELVQWNGKKLIAEYNIKDDNVVRVLTENYEWLFDATLVTKADYLPASRIEEARQNREKAAIKRLQKHIEEKERRAASTIGGKGSDELEKFVGDACKDLPEAPDLSEVADALPEPKADEVTISFNLNDQPEEADVVLDLGEGAEPTPKKDIDLDW